MRFLFFPSLFSLGFASAGELRTWVDNQDCKVEATLVGVKEGTVLLRLKDGNGGRNIGEKIHIPSLQRFFLQDYKSFLSKAQQSYGISALLVYYFFHFDGDGDAKRFRYRRPLPARHPCGVCPRRLAQWSAEGRPILTIL